MVNYYDALLARNLAGGSATLQEKSVSITQNGDSTILPDSGYDGMSKVDVSVNVSGGGEAPENDVEFIDYDGTIVYSYTAEQFLALDAMPANPTHEGLTAQGWNWTLADAKDYVGDYGGLVIGQVYDTPDGSMNIYVSLPEGFLSPYLGICPNGTAVIDWGDGSPTDTLTGTSTSTLQQIQHTYASVGDYKINIKMQDDGKMGLKGTTNSSRLLRSNTSNTNLDTNYASKIIKLNIGSQVEHIGLNSYELYFLTHLKELTFCTPMYTGDGVLGYSCSLSVLIFPPASFGVGAQAIGNSKIKYVSLPKSFSSIGNVSFTRCKNLKKIHIPAGASIGGQAFQKSGLKKVYGIVGSAQEAFDNCFALEEVNTNAPKSKQFADCESLTKVVMTTTGNTIGENAFARCYSLESIVIPSNITTISGFAFHLCSSMSSIRFEGTTPPTVSASTTFGNLPTDCVIYVPYSEDHSVLEAYKTATNYPNPSTYTYVEY